MLKSLERLLAPAGGIALLAATLIGSGPLAETAGAVDKDSAEFTSWLQEKFAY